MKGEDLVLAPFQGPVACTRIKKGRGVCVKAWKRAEILVVPDVDAFPGHIACSSLSRSEIVLPLLRAKGEVWGVLICFENACWAYTVGAAIALK